MTRQGCPQGLCELAEAQSELLGHCLQAFLQCLQRPFGHC